MHRSKKRTNEMLIFALIIALTGIYVSTAFVRLLVFSSIGIIILSAIGLYSITHTVMKIKKQSSSTTIEDTATETIPLNKATNEVTKIKNETKMKEIPHKEKRFNLLTNLDNSKVADSSKLHTVHLPSYSSCFQWSILQNQIG